MDSNRIVNAIRSDEFFGKTRGKREVRRIEAERFTMPKAKAKGIIRRKQAKVGYKQCAIDASKHSTDTVVFTERQLQIAVAALAKGKL